MYTMIRMSRLQDTLGIVLRTGLFLSAVAVPVGQSFAAPGDDKPAEKKNADRLFELHLNDAAQFEIFRGATHTQKLELRRQPVYVCSNPIRDLGQTGAVFVWTYQGRPEVVASIFSHPEKGQRVVVHEFHSLSTEVLEPVRTGENQWRPRAGLALKSVPDADPPSESVRQRSFQLRSLSREFSARSVDYNMQTWELRLLPKELIRYESPELGVIDGALYAFVTDAGTDPEVILVIEARKTDAGVQWQYAVARFSDLDLHVAHKKSEVWASIRSPSFTVTTLHADRQHLYRLYRDRIIDEFIGDQ